MTLCNTHALRDKLHSLYRDLRHRYLLKQSKINFQGRVKLTWASQHSLANASLSCVAVTLHEPRIVTTDRQEFEENLEMKLPSTSLFHRQGNPEDLGFMAGPSAMAGRGDGPARCPSANLAASSGQTVQTKGSMQVARLPVKLLEFPQTVKHSARPLGICHQKQRRR